MTQVAEVTVKTNASDIVAKLAARLDGGLKFAASQLADRIKQRISISNQGGLFPADPGESMHYGSGDAMRSVFSEKAGPLEYHVGFRNLVYARLQEFGGRITIKNREWLTIPASPEALKHKTSNRSAREFPRKLQFIPTRRPDLAFLVERNGDQEIIHYLLRKAVYVPAHPTLRPAAHDPEWQRRAMQGFRGQATGIEVAE